MRRLITALGSITLALATLVPVAAQQRVELTVGTFNLRYLNDHDGPNDWSHRRPLVVDLIDFYRFDLLGTQEGYEAQLLDIGQLPGMERIGVGRDDGMSAGEHSAIFYRSDRFELLEQGDFWLSETPEVPSHGWDASDCLRICSWGHFRERQSGKTLYHFNVHYDHEGREARLRSSLLLLSRIRPLLERGETVILTGDFNAAPEDEPIRILRESALLQDAYAVTRRKPYGPEGTFHDFDPAGSLGERIDYIWVSPDVTVERYRTITDSEGTLLPSDHYPVAIRLAF